MRDLLLTLLILQAAEGSRTRLKRSSRKKYSLRSLQTHQLLYDSAIMLGLQTIFI
jgi:hypothetical protein